MSYLRYITGLFVCVIISGITIAGPTWKMSKADVTIYGTSNLHDWEMQVKEVSSQQRISFINGQLMLEQVDLAVPVNHIESGNSIMDGKMRDALKAGSFPTIRFVAGGVVLSVLKDSFKGSIKGSLQIAGVRKDVEIPVSGTITAGKNLTIKGSYVIDMTQYEVNPPTALFGTLKTGKEVKVSFVFELVEI